MEERALTAQYERIRPQIAEQTLLASEDTPIAARLQTWTDDPKIVVDPETLREAVDTYIAVKRDAHADAYTQANTAWLNETFPASRTSWYRTVELEQPEVTFVSAYSPTLAMKLTADQIAAVCASDAVETVYYDHPMQAEEAAALQTVASAETDAAAPYALSDAGYLSDISYMKTQKGLTGSGVKIGLFVGYHPIGTSEVMNNGVKINTGTTSYIDSAMAAVLNGKSIGLVPNATLYSVAGMEGEWAWYRCIEELLDRGVHVIAISDDAEPMRSTEYLPLQGKWLNHVAVQHSVHVVVSSYGTSAGGLNVLASAQNVITVGAGVSPGSPATQDYYYTSVRHKPDLLAPSTLTVPYGGNASATPTRFSDVDLATAQVAAVVAQLCQQDSALLTRQDAMKSILVSGALTNVESATGYDQGNTMQVKIGAGVLNARRAYSIVRSDWFVNSAFSGSNTSYSKTFLVKSTDTNVRVSVSGLVNAQWVAQDHQQQGIPNHYVWDEVRLQVTAPDGTTWTAVSGGTYLTSHSIRFNPQKNGGAGTYTITVTRVTNFQSATLNFGVSWYLRDYDESH